MLLIGTDKFCTWKISLAVAAPQMKNFCRAISQTPNQNLVPLPGLKIIMLTTKCVLLVLESQRWVQRLNIQSCLQFSTDHPFALDLPVPQAAIETWRDEFHPLLAPPPPPGYPRASERFHPLYGQSWEFPERSKSNSGEQSVFIRPSLRFLIIILGRESQFKCPTHFEDINIEEI